MNKSPQPPKLFTRFLKWFCKDSLQESILGDLEEQFFTDLEHCSTRKTKRRFAWNVVRFFRPGIIRDIGTHSQFNQYGILSNFLKTGWRNFWKYRSNSFIHVSGLSIGLATAMFLYLIIDYEHSFDRFHNNIQNIYRVADKKMDGSYSMEVASPVLPALIDEFPEIVNGTRLMRNFDGSDGFFTYDETAISMSFYVVDSGFADVFSFKTLDGNLKEALSSPGNIVLTESAANQFVADDPIIGKVLSFSYLESEVVVSAIIEDPPKNSTLQFESLISWPAPPNFWDENHFGSWENTFMTAYVKLRDGSKSEALEARTPEFTKKHYIPERKDEKITFIPFTQIHSLNVKNDRSVLILGIIAIAILLISCINFMNLSISQSLKRFREIGIRKVMGAFNFQLIIQFVVEGLITMCFSIVIAVILVGIFLPYFNAYYELDIHLDVLNKPFLMVLIVGIPTALGLISSFLTALILTTPKVLKSLKTKVGWSRSGQFLQRSLLVTQFAIASIFVAGALVIQGQVQYMKNYDLNFNPHHVVSFLTYGTYFKDWGTASRRLALLKGELEQEPSILKVAFGEDLLGYYKNNYNRFRSIDSVVSDDVLLRMTATSADYFDLLEIDIVQGRYFSEHIASDTECLILNESAFKKFGWNDIENKTLTLGSTNYNVIGVVKDYNYRSLSESIEPMCFFFYPEAITRMFVRLHPDRINEGMKKLDEAWNSLGPYQPFDYQFLDDEFNKLYASHERLGATTSGFSGVAVALALFGLFGITTFVINNRRKEIAVRKVLGATILSIILLLSKTIGKPIALAFAIAIPLIYLMADQFLADFSYRMTLSPWIFIGTGLVVFGLAIFITTFQSGQVANENPVNSLKDE